jgi:hypothetical protein
MKGEEGGGGGGGWMEDTHLNRKHRECILNHHTYEDMLKCFENKKVYENNSLLGSSGCKGIFNCVRNAQMEDKCPQLMMSTDLDMCIKYAEKSVPKNNSRIRDLGFCASGHLRQEDRERCKKLGLYYGGPRNLNRNLLVVMNDFNDELNLHRQCEADRANPSPKIVAPILDRSARTARTLANPLSPDSRPEGNTTANTSIFTGPVPLERQPWQ